MPPTMPTLATPPQLHMRWIAQKIASAVAFAPGGASIPTVLRAAGYLDMVWIRLRGTFTGATATLVFKPLMPWNIIDSIVIQGGGPVPTHRLGGFGAHVWNLAMKDWAPFRDGWDHPAAGLDLNTYDASNIDVFPTAVGAQTISLWVGIPFHRSSMDNRGLLPLGVPGQADTTLTVTPTSAVGNIVTTGANLTLPVWVMDVYQCFFTPPAGDANVLPLDLSKLYRFDEASQVATTGDNKILLDRSHKYLGIAHAVILNGVMDQVDVDRVQLTVNGAPLFDPAGLDSAMQNFIQRRRAGRPFPLGVIVHDFDRFVDDGSFDIRDHLYTGRLTEFYSTISVNAGATVVATDRIWTWTRREVDLNPAGYTPGAG